MTSHNPSSPVTPPAASKPNAGATGGSVPSAGSRSSRPLVLLGVLAAALFALWYDYKVARPAVESAFKTIDDYNLEVNSTPGRTYLTEKEIQQKLNRTPAKSYTTGPYQVEVYSWRSGLPIRTHDYYAVYNAGSPLIFLRHYKFVLPDDELRVAAIPSESSASPDAGGQPSEGGEAPAEAEGKGGRPQAEGDAGEAKAQPATDAPSVDSPARAEEKSAPPSEPAAKEPAAKEPAANEPAAKEPPAKEAAPATPAPGDAAPPK